METQTKWLAQIEQGKDGSTQIDMSKEVMRIIQRFLMQILFGANIDDTMITIQARTEKFGVFAPRQFTLSNAIEECFEQCIEAIRIRGVNPLWSLLYSSTGKSYSFTHVEKVSDDNNLIVRDTIRKYIRKRASGQAKSELEDDSDILSLMMQNSDVFQEEDIIDEMIDFMVAGSQTPQLPSQYALSHLMTDPESLSRVRQEFENTYAEKLSFEKAIKDELTLETS